MEKRRGRRAAQGAEGRGCAPAFGPAGTRPPPAHGTPSVLGLFSLLSNVCWCHRGDAQLPHGVKLPRLKLLNLHSDARNSFYYYYFSRHEQFLPPHLSPPPRLPSWELILPVPNLSQTRGSAERGSRGAAEPSPIGKRRWNEPEKLPERIRTVALSCNIRWFKVSLNSC